MKRKNDEPFVRELVLLRDRVEDWTQYPFTIPAVNRLEAGALRLALDEGKTIPHDPDPGPVGSAGPPRTCGRAG